MSNFQLLFRSYNLMRCAFAFLVSRRRNNDSTTQPTMRGMCPKKKAAVRPSEERAVRRQANATHS